MKTINKAFVLGASGYVGHYLSQELLDKHIETTALINRTPLENTNIIQLRGSLTDFDWTRLEANLPDVIFHTARLSGTNAKNRKEAAAKNSRANEQLIKWLESQKNPPLLVFVSGTLVYGSQNKSRVDESWPANPISFQREYFEAEKPILRAMNDQKLPVIIVRPSWIYGPGSWLKAFYLNPSKNKNSIPVYGTGDNLMTFIHVKDVVGLILHVSKNGMPGTIYNLGLQPAITQRNFVQLLCSLTGKKPRQKPLWWIRLRHDKAIAEAFSFSLDVRTKHPEVFRSYTPYFPDLEEGLRKVLEQERFITP